MAKKKKRKRKRKSPLPFLDYKHLLLPKKNSGVAKFLTTLTALPKRERLDVFRSLLESMYLQGENAALKEVEVNLREYFAWRKELRRVETKLNAAHLNQWRKRNRQG